MGYRKYRFFCHQWGDSAKMFMSDEVNEWKSVPIRPTSDNKISFHGHQYIVLFLTRYFMPDRAHKPTKTLIDCSFCHLRRGRPFGTLWRQHSSICNVTLTCGTGIVTSYSSIVLARANWRKGDLHWWITTLNINFSPPGFHGLAWKF